MALQKYYFKMFEDISQLKLHYFGFLRWPTEIL